MTSSPAPREIPATGLVLGLVVAALVMGFFLGVLVAGRSAPAPADLSVDSPNEMDMTVVNYVMATFNADAMTQAAGEYTGTTPAPSATPCATAPGS